MSPARLKKDSGTSNKQHDVIILCHQCAVLPSCPDAHPVPGTIHMSAIQVALIASSGGGVATIGHTQVEEQLQTLEAHLQLIHAKLSYAIHISLLGGKSMDSVNPETDQARLTIVKPRLSSTAPLECKIEATDTLERINLRAFELQKLLAEEIRSGKVDALICTSIHVPLFVNVLQATADRKLVVTGSGGTSLALATVKFPGLKLCGNSGGSVATTSQTRVISYTYGIAQAYRRQHLYKPWKHKNHLQQAQQTSWTSVLNGALPVFWAVMMTKSLLTSAAPHIFLLSPWLAWFAREREKEMEFVLFMLDHVVLPAACSILMATSSHDHTRAATSFASLTMAATIASFGCRDSVIAGLVAGYLVKHSIERVRGSSVHWIPLGGFHDGGKSHFESCLSFTTRPSTTVCLPIFQQQ